MSELKNDDLLLVNRGGVDYKITMQDLAEYLQVEPIPEPEPVPEYSTTLTTKSSCEANCKAGEYARGKLAGWTTEITTASTEPPKFYFRVMKNCQTSGKNIDMNQFVAASAWIEYDGTVQSMGEVSMIGDNWVAFYIEDKAVCGDEVQQLRSGNYQHICWPAILTPGEVTETVIGKFTADNVKLSEWNTDHPYEEGWIRWSFKCNGRIMNDEEQYVNGQAPSAMIYFLNGGEINRETIKPGDVVTAETVYEYWGQQGCHDKPWNDTSCTVTVTPNITSPWEDIPGNYHVIISDPDDITVFDQTAIYDLATSQEVAEIDKAGEFMVCGDGVKFRNSKGNFEFGNLTDVSEVTQMERLFYGCEFFNQDISDWDTSNCTNMRSMFHKAINFNQPIGKWDTSKVENMAGMFGVYLQEYESDWKGHHTFNQDIGDWDVSNVINMNAMFRENNAFNQDLSKWQMAKPIDRHGNEQIMDVQWMFQLATAFNGNIANWDMSQMTNLYWMFDGCTSFNQDIGIWNTSRVNNMDGMFRGCTEFNQDLSGWCVDNSPYGHPGGETDHWMFDTNATKFEDKNKPVWGTCPRGEKG